MDHSEVNAAATPAAVEAQAAADLSVVCAELQFDESALTQFEKFLWRQAYRRGAVHALEIAKAEIRAMGVA